MKRALVAMIFATALGASDLLAESPVPLVNCPISSLRPTMDGQFSEGFWRDAADLGPFLRADGLGLPTAPTRARVARTGEALCIGVECLEPRMDRLIAQKRDRDGQLWPDDCVEVFVQRPGQEYLHFIVNPLGAQFDEKGKDSRWNAEWQAATSRGKGRWSVELALPWKALGGTPKSRSTPLAAVILPSGATRFGLAHRPERVEGLLGSQPEAGTISVWARPSFNPEGSEFGDRPGMPGWP